MVRSGSSDSRDEGGARPLPARGRRFVGWGLLYRLSVLVPPPFNRARPLTLVIGSRSF